MTAHESEDYAWHQRQHQKLAGLAQDVVRAKEAFQQGLQRYQKMSANPRSWDVAEKLAKTMRDKTVQVYVQDYPSAGFRTLVEAPIDLTSQEVRRKLVAGDLVGVVVDDVRVGVHDYTGHHYEADMSPKGLQQHLAQLHDAVTPRGYTALRDEHRRLHGLEAQDAAQ